jgi:nicotinamide-nucleotide amidase
MGSPADLVDQLKALDATLATAESLTGGRVAARVTNVPGSSAVYAGGVVSYQTEVKVAVLGVAAATVDEHGVVSAECAREMAAGARRLLGTTYAVSTTGVAGPDRQEGKEVGTVFVGVAGPGGVDAVQLDLDGDRATIQEATVDEALSVLADMISSDSRPAEDSGLG